MTNTPGQTPARQGGAALHLFLTSKPYSYAGEIARAVVFALALGTSATGQLGLVALQAMTAWLYFNWQSDWIQASPERIRPPFLLVAMTALTTLGIGLAGGGAAGAIGVVVQMATIVAYSPKSRHRLLGPWGPALRTLTVWGQFAMVCGLLRVWPDPQSLLLVTSLSIFQGVRNLVGDVRDVRSDLYELPAQYGIMVTRRLIRVGFVAALVPLLWCPPSPGLWAAAAWMVLSWLIAEWLEYSFGDAGAHKWGYLAHRILVLTTTAAYLSMGVGLGLPTVGAIALAAVALGSHLAYGALPGKAFPRWSELADWWRPHSGRESS